MKGRQEVHDEANRRVCGICHQPVGVRCVQPGTDQVTRIPHLARMTGRLDATLTREVPTS